MPGRAYQVCALTGVVAGIALAGAVAAMRGIVLWKFAAAVACALAVVGMFLFAVLRATGRERLVFFHDEAVAFVAAGVAFRALGGDPLALLDTAAVTLATISMVGRIGCLTAGCCHGRPARTGIVYGQEHVDAGLDPRLMGVPLVPVQMIESMIVAVILAGLVPLAAGARPGTAFVTWLAAYGGARYCTEFLRGDNPWRPSFAGRTHAQWTAVARLWVAVALGSVVQPRHGSWIVIIAVGMTASCISRVRSVARAATGGATP